MASGVTDLALRSPAALGLGRDDLIRAFRLMYLSRRIDDREILLKRQSKIYFQISGAGHEAIQTAAGMLLRPGHDWFFPYYRDRALCLTLGVTLEEMLLQAVGAAADPSSGGRQMPSHWSNPRLHIVSPSSATGTQFLPALGCADAQRRLEPGTGAITVATTGDGATSEGEFWESLNIACLEKMALLYLVEDNGWAGFRIPRPEDFRMRWHRLPGLLCHHVSRHRALPPRAISGAGACPLHAPLCALVVRRRASL
jgi:2-oxoisovalerate dehydrogenase E1 component